MRLSSVLLLAASACMSLAATPAQWKTKSIYFVVTDRFARTDGSNTAACDLKAAKYCGGSWQGLINKLDYIKNMGFTAVWITPITHNIEQTTSAGQAYHGYWQDDIYSLNEHYGTEADLKALAKALHDRGMYFMVDVVANHFAFAGGPNNVQYAAYQPFNSSSYFHSPCAINDYNNQSQVEQCWLGYNTAVELTDLDTTKQSVKDLYNSWIKSLVQKYSIDGLRVDTVKHVNKDFWPGFNSASGVYNIGEVFSGDPKYLCDYQNYMDGLLNYALYYPLTRAFQSTSGSMSDLVNSVNQVKSTCKDSTLLGPFLENHDNARFPSLTSDLALAQNAIAFTLLADGVPILYYGQEQHLNGATDPYDREALWLTGYKTDAQSAPLYGFIAKVNQIRNVAIAKDANYVNYKAYPIYNDTTTIAMRKGYDNGQIVGVFSNKGANGASYTQTIGNTGFTSGQQLVEIVGCTKQNAGSNGAITVAMGKGQAKIFYPTAKLAGTGVCGM